MQKYRNQMLLGLGFSLLVVIGVIAIFNARDLIQELDKFTLWLFLPMMVLKFMNWGFRYWEWHYFLNVIGVKISPSQPTTHPTDTQPAIVNLKDCIILWTAGLPIAISPGKIAEVLKAFILKNMAGVPVPRSMPVVFAERLVDGIAVVFLAAVSGIVASSLIATDEVSLDYVRGVLGIAVVFMLGVIAVAQIRPLAYKLIDGWGYLPYVKRYQHALREFYDSSYEIIKLRHLMPTVGMGTVGYFSDGVIFYLILLGVGEKPSLELFAVSIFILGFSVIVAALSAMPGGAGGRELTIGALLTTIVGLEKSAIGLTVLLVGFSQIWFGTLIGIVVIIVFRHTLFPPSLAVEIEAYDKQDHQKEVLTIS